MIFRISAAAELALFALAKRAQTASPSQRLPRLRRGLWDSLNAQAPLAKINIRSKLWQGHFFNNLRLSGGLAGLSGTLKSRAGMVAPRKGTRAERGFLPSAALPRWGKASVPAKDSQDRTR